MGNRLASQIASSEYYLHDVPGFVLKTSLGRARFLKTLQCIHDEGLVIVKVYIKAAAGQAAAAGPPQEKAGVQQDDLSYHLERLQSIREKLLPLENAYPFHQFIETDNAGYMVRQFFASNLSDRLSTLPFLTALDKCKWITFQMLSGLAQLHGAKVMHGDLKAENVMLTNSNWVFITDVACYKPVSLPEDNPADFSFFFDSSGTRSCYIAPERFFKQGQTPLVDFRQSMDIFSLGCVIAELFLEGTRIFDLSQLLDYRQGNYDPKPALTRITEKGIAELVAHMIQLLPESRHDADAYLRERTPSLFPPWFEHLRKFASTLNDKTADERIAIISKHFNEVVEHLTVGPPDSAPAAPVAVSPVAAASAQSPPPMPVLPDSVETPAFGISPTSAGAIVESPGAAQQQTETPPQVSTERTPAPPTPSAAAAARPEDEQATGPPPPPVAQKKPAISPARRPMAGGTEEMIATSALLVETETFYQQAIIPLEKTLSGDPKQDAKSQALPAEIDAAEAVKHEKPRSPPVTTIKSQTSVVFPVSPLLPEALQKQRREQLKTSHASLPRPQFAQIEGLSLLVPYVTSSIRSCKFASSKVVALDLLVTFAKHVNDECRLQRIVPYVVSLLFDQVSYVRAAAIKALASAVELVSEVPASDVQIFTEYLLPAIHQVSTSDSEEIVRISLASSLASLADSSRRFLEASQLLKQQAMSIGGAKSMLAQQQESFDKDMANLVKPFSDIMQDLLTRYTTSAIKRAFMNDVARLCVFFGQQRTNDLLLPLIITFLNDKDWRVREAFFHNMVGVASFVGRHSLETFILPCIQQALVDSEEFVVDQTIASLACLCELGLFKKHTLIELCEKCAPMLLHPNVWIRYGVIGVVEAITQQLGAADSYCFLNPLLHPFLLHDIMYITKNTLLQSVLPPISRASLNKAKLLCSGLTNGSQQGERSSFASQIAASGIPQVDCKKLYAMEAYVVACSRGSASFEEDTPSAQPEKFLQMRFPVQSATGAPGSSPGVTLATSRRLSVAPSVDSDSTVTTSTTVHQTQSIPRVVLHEGWHDVFATPVLKSTPETTVVAGTQPAPAPATVASGNPAPEAAPPQVATGSAPKSKSPAPMVSPTVPLQAPSPEWRFDLGSLVSTPWTGEALRHLRPKGTHIGHLCEHTGPVTKLRVSPDNLFFASGSYDGSVKIWDCQRLERNVTNRSRRTYSVEHGRITSLAICENTHSVACGTDQGQIHVFRVDYTPTTQLYGNLVPVRKYDKQTTVVCIESWLQPGSHVILYGLSSGMIGGIDLRSSADSFRFVNESRYGQLETFVVGPGQNWLVAGTSRGFYLVWDIRFGLPVHIWRQPSKSRIRRLVHKEGDLVVAAAGSDDIIVWDVSTATVTQLLRVVPLGVQMPELSLLAHANPAPPMEFGAEELRALQSWGSSALTDQRHSATATEGAAAASSAPAAATSSSLASSSSAISGGAPAAGPGDVEMDAPQLVRTTALYCNRNFILSGGSDRCVRFWETKSIISGAVPASYTICGAEQPTVYSSSVIEGCVVQQATAQPNPPASSALPPPASAERGLVTAARFHRDTILDIQAIESPHSMMLTAGRDGVIKVWK